MDEFERNLYRELEKSSFGSGKLLRSSSCLDSRTAQNINNVTETLATLFSDMDKDSTSGVIIYVHVCELMLTAKCELSARFCDLAAELSQQLISAGHIQTCIDKGKLVLSNPRIVPGIQYSIVEFRIIQTEEAPHLHRVVWLKAEFNSPRKEESQSNNKSPRASTTHRSEKQEGRL